MNRLAAAATIALAVPFLALAQSAPPSVSLESEPQPTVAASNFEPDSPLDLTAYPAAQRDEIWEHYARKSVVSVNILYPLSGGIVLTLASGFSQSSGGDPLGAISLPVEYERSLTRGLSVFGMLQPTFATGEGKSELSMAAGAGVRGYLEGNAPQGLWLGAEADTALGAHAVTTRFEVGFNALYSTNLTVSFGGGVGVTYASDTVNPISGSAFLFSPAAGLRFAIGYAI